MITREDADRLRDQLLAVLQEDAHNTERLLARLDTISREAGVGAHAALLLILSRLAFDEQEARRYWQSILSHRDAMSASLGRDVGVRVALFDYFVNVNRRLVHPTLIDLEMFDARMRAGSSDSLTGLANDRSFRAAVQSETRRAKRYGHRVAVALFDADDFAGVNRRIGRLVADRILREAAMLLSNKIRDIDVAARPGEDEFAVVLPETDRAGALLVADRFRLAVEEHFARREFGGRPVGLTVTGGVACCPEDAGAPESLLECAAQALYCAKASGKNVVSAFQRERRRYLRFELEPGRFEIEVLAPKEIGRTRTRNLSRNGILFASPEALEVGEEIELRVVGGDPSPPASSRLRGRVVRLEQIPEADGRGALEPAPAEGDRYEVGVVFDREQAEGAPSLAELLERARSGLRE